MWPASDFSHGPPDFGSLGSLIYDPVASRPSKLERQHWEKPSAY
jgi:hypothetical protein